MSIEQQSKVSSALESVTNVVVGYIVGLVTQLTIFPLFGIDIELRDNVTIGAIFTAVSLIRSYTLRRVFTKLRSITL